MISEADGDSTPLGQRPSVLPVVYRLWASLRLEHLREWVDGWLPQSVFSLGNGLSVLDCAVGRLGLPDWFRGVYFSFHRQVRLRFKLAGLGEP